MPINVETINAARLEVILTVQGDHAGLAVDVSPAEMDYFIRQVEDSEPMKAFRRQRSLEAAREASSHEARRSRR